MKEKKSSNNVSKGLKKINELLVESINEAPSDSLVAQFREIEKKEGRKAALAMVGITFKEPDKDF